MGAKDGAGSLVSLRLVLLVSGDVTGVSVGQTSNYGRDVTP